MSKTRNIAVPATGTFVTVSSTIWARRVEIVEDENANVRQGLAFQLPDDNFTQTYADAPLSEPIIIGNVVAHGNNDGNFVGRPANTGRPVIAATQLIKLSSKTATPTVARVVEYE